MSGPKVWFDCLLSGSHNVRSQGERALAALTPDRRILPELIAYLGSERAELRYLAARAIERVGRQAGEALPALIGALADGDATVRAWAVRAVGRLGWEGRPAIPTLLGMLADPSSGLRLAVIGALCQLDHTSRLVPALSTTLGNDPDAHVRGAAARALADLATAESVEALSGALADGDIHVRRAAVISLRCLGREARPAAEALRALLARGVDEHTAMEARAALRLMGPA
jgi:HEAT repeat protein